MALPPIAAALELHSAVLLGQRPPALRGAQLRYISPVPARRDFLDANFEVGGLDPCAHALLPPSLSDYLPACLHRSTCRRCRV